MKNSLSVRQFKKEKDDDKVIETETLHAYCTCGKAMNPDVQVYCPIHRKIERG